MKDRELDVLIAEKVFGKVPCTAECHTTGHPQYFPGPCHAQPDSPDQGAETPCYTTQISDAWTVIEEMRKRGIDLAVTPAFGGKWSCQESGDCDVDFMDYYSVAETAPRAICEAALKAVEFQQKGRA